MKRSLVLTTLMLALAVVPVTAASLKQAEFTRVINDVKVLPESATPVPAKVGDTVTSRTAVATGAQSRAELRFPDKTLTRLGANSVFRMDQGTRTVEVEKGVILLQVPKQLGGAQVRTAAVTAAVTGTTVMVEYTADGYIKIIVVEGEVDVFLNANRRVFRTLTPGDLWITRANDTTGLPLPVKIDLRRLQRTSKLLDATEFGPLGNQDEMAQALEEQAKAKLDGELLATAFRIEGRGRQLMLTQGDRQHVRLKPVPPAPTPPPSARREPTVVGRRPAQPPGGGEVDPNKPVNVPEATVFDSRSTLRTVPPATAFNSVSGAVGPLPGSVFDPSIDSPFNLYMYDDPAVFVGIDGVLAAEDAWFVFKGDEIFLAGNVTIDTTGGPRSLILGATRDFRFTADPPFGGAGLTTGNTWTLNDAVDALVFSSLNGSVVVDDFSVLGGGQNILFYGDSPESDVRVVGRGQARLSLPQGSLTATAGRDVEVAGATVEARTIAATAGRDIRLGGENGGTTLQASDAITATATRSLTIANSTQLRRLTEADPLQVTLEAVNGTLAVEGGSSIDADVIQLASRRGDVRLIGSTLSGREIKARVFDTGGTLVLSNATLGRGTNPADLIRLYGEGAGGVRFTGDTTLRGAAVDIAGATVTIDPGSRVRLSHPSATRVFADTHNYNNRINGNFTGLADGQAGAAPVEVNRQPFANRPPP